MDPGAVLLSRAMICPRSTVDGSGYDISVLKRFLRIHMQGRVKLFQLNADFGLCPRNRRLENKSAIRDRHPR
jgi:hypothetical protein